MKTIALFTTTRAEFGILSALLSEIQNVNSIEYKLFVGGSHLATENGKTVKEIQKSNYKIEDYFDYQLNLANDVTIAKSIGFSTIELANIFKKGNFDFVCVLGDRVELLSIITNAIIFKKPIIHIHGGERSEGAVDEQVRHMITKASHIHFAACEEYAENIRRMGEEEWRVHNVGALAVDNMLKFPKKEKAQLFRELGLDIKKSTILMTYHPVTLEFNLSPLDQISNLFEALSGNNYQIIVTAPNADENSDIILEYIQEKVTKNENIHYIESLGVNNYLNLIPFCDFVIGNSSSAIIEVPFFKIPVINIGNRQSGRIFHDNIICCTNQIDSIKRGINQARSLTFRTKIQYLDYKFGNGNTAKKILNILMATEVNTNLLQKKLIFTNE